MFQERVKISAMAKAFDVRRTRFLEVVLVLFLWLSMPSIAFAMSSAASGPMARWPMLLFCGLVAVSGLVFSRIFSMWFELDGVGRLRRVLGLAVSSMAVFLFAFASTESPPLHKNSEMLSWHVSYDVAREIARAQHKPLMLDFTASWCGACHELEAEVFHAKDVSKRLAREFVLVKIDFDQDTPTHRALLQKFEVSGLPRIAFEDPEGVFLKRPSFEGKLKVEDFLARLDEAKSGVGVKKRKGALERALYDGDLWASLILVFLAGVLSSLTPCVYPLIPITISVFGAQGAKSRVHAFMLSLTYVVGIAITYSVLGVAAAMFGTVFGGAMQSPWVLVGIATVFVFLGLGSLEVFHIRLPGFLQDRLGGAGRAGFVGALVMGLVGGLVAAPCVGPIVAGVLVHVAQAQDVFLGWILLMTFSFGMGLLFLVLGTFSSLLHKLPNSGSWMVGVKGAFGAVFFGMALYYLRLMVPPLSEGARLIWSCLGGLAG